MIKIRKPKTYPIVPDNKGNCKLVQKTDENNNSYDLNPHSYNSGYVKFEFFSDIYGHENIKKTLIKCQYGKCAFCEQNVLSIAYGDIEHFRPKKGYKQYISDKLRYAGYYWLAYKWDNLLFSCAICNQRFKGNLFPLIDPYTRAKNHNEDIKKEKPYFINPAQENPRFLIQFSGPLAIGIDKKHRGKKTIEAIGLNRKGKNGISDLYEERLDYFEIMKEIYKISLLSPSPQISQQQIDTCKELFKRRYSKKKRFFAMISDNFPPPTP